MTQNESKDDKNDTKIADRRSSGSQSASQLSQTELSKDSNFFKRTKAEFDKIVWPTRQQLISESAAVILMVVVSALLVFLVDKMFGTISTCIFAPNGCTLLPAWIFL